MTKWEYLVKADMYGLDWLENRFNELGADGWELVSIKFFDPTQARQQSKNENLLDWVYVFKRKKAIKRRK